MKFADANEILKSTSMNAILKSMDLFDYLAISYCAFIVFAEAQEVGPITGP